MGKIVGDAPCPNCRENGRDTTGNHLILFEDGCGYCNRCDVLVDEEGVKNLPEKNVDTKDPLSSDQWETRLGYIEAMTEVTALTDRGIRQDVAELYGVRCYVKDGEVIEHYYPVHDQELNLVGFYVRRVKDKKFWTEGNVKGRDRLPFGSALIQSGRVGKVFITEGQCDAMALCQALLDLNPEALEKYGPPAVVATAGNSGRARLTAALERIGSRPVVVVPDADEAGQKLAQEASQLFPQCTVITLPDGKDPNDLLKEGQGKSLATMCLSRKAPAIPEKIILAENLSLDELLNPIKEGVKLQSFPVLMSLLGGLRYGEGAGELTVIVSGSGMGKSTLVRELGYGLLTQTELNLAEIRLEERNVKTIQSYVAMHYNVPLNQLRVNPNLLSREQWLAAKKQLLDGRLRLLDHFGSLASDRLLDKIKHLYYGQECPFIILDHLSMVVSGQESNNERKDIDILMTKLAAFCENSGASVLSVVHLRRPQGDTGYNEGMRISLAQLRGSAAIEQLSHNVISIEGDQSGDEKDIRFLNVLKNRETGDIGQADTAKYNRATGRLYSISDVIA